MPRTRAPRLKAETVSAATLQHWLRRAGVPLTDRRLRQIAFEGFFPEPERGQYRLPDVLVGLVKYYKELRTKEGGTLAAERLRKLHEEADKLALDNERTRGGLVEIEAVYKHFEGLFVALRARILASSLEDQEKDELLNDLRKLKAGDLPEQVRAGQHSQPAAGSAETAPALQRR